MNSLTIGQLTIPIALLSFFVAILYSDFRSRGKDTYTNKTIEQLFILYVIVWKGSYILFSWPDFIKAPLSLLYFDGGGKGHMLALVVIAIILYKRWNALEWQILWQYWARFTAVYHVIHSGFEGQWVIAGIWLALLIMIERKYGIWQLFAQWLLLLWLGGLEAGFTQVHVGVMLTILLKMKQVQHLAIIGVVSLVVVMLTDIKKTSTPMERVAIELPTTTGEEYRLAEQEQTLKVVNFFATSCPPCKAEMPHLQSFAEDLPANVELIGVNLTARDNGKDVLEQFLETYEVTYPILLDQTDKTGKSFQVMSIPTTVILNEEGRELDRIVGPISEHALRKLVNQHM